MHLHAERWNPRPAWLRLSIPERTSYLDRLGADFLGLTEAGVKLEGMALNDAGNFPGLPYYVAIWSMPDRRLHMQMLEDILEKVGWHEYFDRVEIGDGTVEFEAPES